MQKQKQKQKQNDIQFPKSHVTKKKKNTLAQIKRLCIYLHCWNEILKILLLGKFYEQMIFSHPSAPKNIYVNSAKTTRSISNVVFLFCFVLFRFSFVLVYFFFLFDFVFVFVCFVFHEKKRNDYLGNYKNIYPEINFEAKMEPSLLMQLVLRLSIFYLVRQKGEIVSSSVFSIAALNITYLLQVQYVCLGICFV